MAALDDPNHPGGLDSGRVGARSQSGVLLPVEGGLSSGGLDAPTQTGKAFQTPGQQKASERRSEVKEERKQRAADIEVDRKSGLDGMAKLARKIASEAAEQAVAGINIVGGGGLKAMGSGRNWVISGGDQDVVIKRKAGGRVTALLNNENGTFVLYQMLYRSRNQV